MAPVTTWELASAERRAAIEVADIDDDDDPDDEEF
jgi:hypothetical protein